MFTGLIEAVGEVSRLQRSGPGARLEVGVTWPDIEIPRSGDSVAVNGACLTVLEPSSSGFIADLSPETLARTLLARTRPGEPVNLERALRLGDRLGGHLVQGHVDTIARLLAITPEGGCSRWRLSLDSKYARQVAEKGSVTLHGISLTVARLDHAWFEVALIPQTLRATVLHTLRTGAELHLETDVLAKYVHRMLGEERTSTAVQEFLAGGRSSNVGLHGASGTGLKGGGGDA